jgi:hypothetical protein
LGVALGAEVNVGTTGLLVNDGIRVGVDIRGGIVAVMGSEVSVTVGKICVNGRIKHQQHAAGKRINIIIKKRRMDIL